ncbi:MAG: hypothetical protein WCZ27_03025 [Tissierellaceae bacterium]
MSYSICKRCNELFERNGKDYCPSCTEKLNKEYDLIIDYIKKSPQATVVDIIIDTGVSLKTINLMVEEGYVSYVPKDDKDIDNRQLVVKIQKLVKRGKFYSRELAK